MTTTSSVTVTYESQLRDGVNDINSNYIEPDLPWRFLVQRVTKTEVRNARGRDYDKSGYQRDDVISLTADQARDLAMSLLDNLGFALAVTEERVVGKEVVS